MGTASWTHDRYIEAPAALTGQGRLERGATRWGAVWCVDRGGTRGTSNSGGAAACKGACG